MAQFTLKGVNGQLDVYEDKVEITRKGFWGFMTQGLAGNKTIPFSSIVSIQIKKAGTFVNGYIQFGVFGAVEKRGGIFNATEDENSLVFTSNGNNLAEQIKRYIEEQKAKASAPQTVPPPPPSQVSAADEIIKLKQLLDAGILTEEFTFKKRQLLGM